MIFRLEITPADEPSTNGRPYPAQSWKLADGQPVCLLRLNQTIVGIRLWYTKFNHRARLINVVRERRPRERTMKGGRWKDSRDEGEVGRIPIARRAHTVMRRVGALGSIDIAQPITKAHGW